MIIPALGSIVGYVDEHNAHGIAIISKVWHDDVVRLHVLTETGVSVMQQVSYSAFFADNSWYFLFTGNMTFSASTTQVFP